jgi:predicted dehydrogenase
MEKTNIKIGVIGIGHIFPYYLKALAYVPEIEIKSVFDMEVKTTEGNLYFCKNMEKMLNDEEIKAIMISTPPGTHFELAKKVLMAGKDVILEKPPVEKTSQLEELGALANAFGNKVISSFHAGYCLALKHFLKDLKVTNQGTFHSKLGKLKTIFSCFLDPYVVSGRLKENIALGGSWMDSGPNALSVILQSVSSIEITRAVFDVPKYSGKNCREVAGHISFDFPDGCGDIFTSWNLEHNSKTTIFVFEKGGINVHHTEESLYTKENKVLKNLKEAGVERLTHHYIGAFRDIFKMIRSGENNFYFATNVMTALEDAYNAGGVKI